MGFRAISVDLKRAQDNFFRTGCSGALALAVFMSMNRCVRNTGTCYIMCSLVLNMRCVIPVVHLKRLKTF